MLVTLGDPRVNIWAELFKAGLRKLRISVKSVFRSVSF